MYHKVKPGETLATIAVNYRRTLQEILKANPNIINPNIIVPNQLILIPGLPDPNSIPYRIDVSVDSKLLTLYRNNTMIKKYPIATGKMLTATPVGEYVIVNRAPNPGGPYGAMWLTLSKAGYGIHGTNNPSSIGKSVSKGCIRMYNKDVLELSSIVPNGTRVIIHR
ncbi:L,D-transpeptidase family protein [Robertmurraya mangrovi]|uniref:L,D-transpeptidase family protein n=1 Tax=Robertmurraya mangrovi TaxID=3098077 RepID=UPI00389A7AF0